MHKSSIFKNSRENQSKNMSLEEENTVVTCNEKLFHPILNTLPALNELSLKYPKAISLGSGRPASQFCQPEQALELLNIYKEYVHAQNPDTLLNLLLGQYGPSAGIINEIVAKHLDVDEGIKVSPKAIVITVGFQEAIELCVKALFKTTDVLIIPDPIFIGVTGSALLNGVNIFPMRWKGDSFNEELFNNMLESIKLKSLNAKAMYLIPDFNNPYSTCLTLEDRLKILDWADKNNILLIEDNAYSMFRYKGEKIPTLKSLDKKKRVIYISTAAKTIYPALRIGYVVADQICEVESGPSAAPVLLATKLAEIKAFLTVNTPALEQAIFASALLKDDYSLKKTTEKQVNFNRDNLSAMLLALEKYFPKEKFANINWNSPQGGYFIVMNLPFVFGIEDLEKCADEFGVIVIPLSMFSLLDESSTEIRLSFTNVSAELIDKAIERLSNYVSYKLELLKTSEHPMKNFSLKN